MSPEHVKKRNVQVFWFFPVKTKALMKQPRTGVHEIICKGAQNFYTKDVFSSILRSCWRGKITFFLCYCYDK